MTTGGWLWLVGGAIFAAACAVAWERFEAEDGEWTAGLMFLTVWAMAPLVAAAAALLGLIGGVTWLIRRVERRIPERKSREALEARIAELERDLQVN